MFSLSFRRRVFSVLKENFPCPGKRCWWRGASGLVGYAAVEHFAQQDDWDVVGVSRRIPDGLEGAEVISVDLTDTARCAEVFGRMSDVTHLVYAALYEKPGLVEGWFQKDQMETNLAMLNNLFSPLEAVAQNLQHVSLLQGTKAYGVHIEPLSRSGPANAGRATNTRTSIFCRKIICASDSPAKTGTGQSGDHSSSWANRWAAI